jgi:hypothetical protein
MIPPQRIGKTNPLQHSPAIFSPETIKMGCLSGSIIPVIKSKEARGK